MCDCCDPTSDSPDPVVKRLEGEVEELTNKIGELGRERDSFRDALYTARRELDVSGKLQGEYLGRNVELKKQLAKSDARESTLRGLLREACEAWPDGAVHWPPRLGGMCRRPALSQVWYERAQAALKGKQ
jgi:hypothetical protein